MPAIGNWREVSFSLTPASRTLPNLLPFGGEDSAGELAIHHTEAVRKPCRMLCVWGASAPSGSDEVISSDPEGTEVMPEGRAFSTGRNGNA